MRNAVQYLRSLVFVGQMYLAMPVIGLLYMAPALVSRAWAFRAVNHYCRWVRWTAGWMVGLRSEVRGVPPTGEVLIAAKHQSFFDIILLVSAVPRPRFIMKKSLRRAPILGWYAMRIGCVPVDRGKRGQAIAAMVDGVANGRKEPGQLIIYPQGTRVAPGVKRPFKVGAGILYEQFAHDCIPAATNVGVFWPRTGIYRKPGLAVVEFLPRIAAGKPVPAFMQELERVVEDASNRLMQEAGFRPEG
ncbi:lysophospholipid acyltransferase family protein [Rhodovulum euryhalinum]|uniref:1-acyl-sn-glycerol-3-phosphate acyltransferase n=1 Tax=Rhodovulum euryhalinum TaxID=35805 RepID=A0A4R2KFY7_9RHOB|nr:1-acyl-sn-glycerol-3-phosphate acyltransferase [Rhodovulum euryhalinum]TCO71167.1 1-acyl-sn-glycerol-3-phosphate acyltransferase [Rhodovulum euryhalinum]